VSDRGRGEGRSDRDDPGGAPLTAEEERDLLGRASGGDTRAYGRLVAAYQDRVFGLVFRALRDQAVAEEVTQDVFLKAYRSLASFRGDAKFTTWLYRIAVNACRDHRGSRAARKQSRETSLEGPDGEGTAPPPASGRPDLALEASEVETGFRAGLDSLEPRQREAFLLRHEEGLSYDEIAVVLGISIANAKVRVHRAREALLKTLRDRGFDV
jgi:RNA polymerase sigma-70 factor (ECF subfamily)